MSLISVSRAAALVLLGLVALAPRAGVAEPYTKGSGVTLVVPAEEAILGAEGVAEARAVVDAAGRHAVEVRFTPAAGKRLAKLTSENVGKRMLLIVGDRVLSAPVAQSPILGGAVLISGSFTKAEAEALATSLRGE